MTLYATTQDVQELHARVARIEKAVTTMAWWLVQAQTGFGEQDARGIERILSGAASSQKEPSDGAPTDVEAWGEVDR